MKNINIEEVKRYLKRSLKKKVKITTSLIVLFMMSNSIVSGNVIMIDGGKISASTKPKVQSIPNQRNKTVALNPNSERDNTVGIDNVAEGSVAVGYDAKASGGSSVAVGYNANAKAEESVAIGHESEATFRESVSIGLQSKIKGDQGISIGSKSAAEKQSVAIGGDTYALGESSIAIGNDDIGGNDYLPVETINRIYKGIVNKKIKTNEEFESSYIKSKQYSPTYAGGKSAIAIGSRSVASADQSIAMGVLSFALAEGSTAIGRYAFVDENANQGLAVGEKARVFSAHSLALGSENESTSEGSMSYGYKAKAVGEGSLAIGNKVASNAEIKNISNLQNIFNGNSDINGKKSSIEKYNPEYVETNITKFTLSGKDVKPLKHKGKYGLTLGSNAYSIGDNSMTIGSLSLSEGKNSLALGVISYAKGDNSMAIGTESISEKNNSMAIGIGAKANLENSLALGNKSITDYQTDWLVKPGYVPEGAISLPSSTNVGVISVGSIGQERRVTNVAAGYRDTDAVNVSQLKSVEDKLSAINVSNDSALVNFVSVDKTTAGSEGKKMQDLAIKMARYKEYIQLKAKLLEMKVRKEKNHEDINGKVKEHIENILKEDKYKSINGKEIQEFKKLETSNEDVKEILKKINEEKDKLIKEENLKKGILTSNEQTLFNASNFYNKSTTGKDAVAIGAFAKASGSEAIAIGKESLASGNNSIVIGTKNSTTDKEANDKKNDNETSKDILKLTSDESGVAIGHGVDSGKYAVGIGANVISKKASVAIGDRSRALGENSVAIGQGSKVNNIDSVAIGKGSEANTSTAKAYLTDDQNNGGRTFAVGGTDIKRRITGVADGSDESDAVTVAQLKKLSEKGITFKDDNDTKTTVGLAGEIKISGKEENNHRNISVTTNNKNLEVTLSKTLKGITSIENGDNSAKLTLNNDNISVNSKKITGLADGDISTSSTDAVTGKQLEARTKFTIQADIYRENKTDNSNKDIDLPISKKIIFRGASKSEEIEVNGENGKEKKSVPKTYDTTYATENVRTYIEKNENKDYEVIVAFKNKPKFDKVQIGEVGNFVISKDNNGFNFNKKKLGNVAPGRIGDQSGDVVVGDQLKDYVKQIDSSNDDISAIQSDIMDGKNKVGVKYTLGLKQDLKNKINKIDDKADKSELTELGNKQITFIGDTRGANKADIKVKLGEEIQIKAEDHWNFNKTDKKFDESQDNYETENLSTYYRIKDGKKQILIGMKSKPNFEEINIKREIEKENKEKEYKEAKIGINDEGKVTLTDAQNTTASPIVTEATVGNQKIKYIANNEQTKKETTLTNGFNFSDGTNTKAEVGDNGVVKFNLKDALTGIKSIEKGTNGTKITLNENDITVNKKLTGLVDGTDNTDAVNMKQLNELKETVTTNTSSIEGNKTEIAKKLNKDDLSITGDTYISVENNNHKYTLSLKADTLGEKIDLSKNSTITDLTTKVTNNTNEIKTVRETVGKGIKFKSDFGKEIETKLDGTLGIHGGKSTNNEDKSWEYKKDQSSSDAAIQYTTENVMTKVDDGKIYIGLKKNTQFESVTFGENGPKLSKDANNNLSIDSKKITGLADGTDNSDAVNKKQLDEKANRNASNLSSVNLKSWSDRLGHGKIEKDNKGLVNGKAVYDFVNPIIQTVDKNKESIDKLTKNILSQTIGYKANDESAKKVSLENGFTFKNTDNITSKAKDKGEISFELNKDLKKISSIESDGTEEAKKTKVTLTENGTEFKTGTDGVTTKIGKDGIEITKGSKTVSITTTDKGGSITGLEERKVSSSNYGEAGRVATEGAVKEIYDQLNSNNGVSNKLNEVRNGLAGTVIYTDKDGNKLVKLKDGKYYNSDYVDEKGNLKVGHTYDKGLESHNIFATVVNPDGSTKEPTTKLRIADGSISAGSKEAVTGGQLHTELAKKLDEATYETDKKTFATKKELENSNVEVAGTTGEIIVTPETKADDKGTKYTVKLENALKTKIDGALQSSTAEITYAKIDGKNLINLDDTKKKAWATGIGISKIEENKDSEQLVTDKAVKEYLTTEIGKVNNSIGNKTIAYKANSDDKTKKETTLTTGFNFTSDDLEIKTENDGKVTFNLTDKVKNSLNGKDNDGRDGKSGYNSAGSKGLTGNDGLNGKDLTTKVNALRNGEAGTVVYTDKDGNRLVKANNGKYYNSEYVDDKGNLKVGHTYDKGLESYNIFATLVNSDGTTDKPTTKLRIADGSISAGSKDAINGGQVYDKLKEYALKDASNIDVTNWVTKLGDDSLESGSKLAKSSAVKEYVDKIKSGLEDKGLTFDADQGGEQAQKLGSSIKIASATEEISDKNIKYLGKNIKTKIAKDGDNSIISLAFSDSPEFSSVKIGNNGKTVSITTTDKGGSITGLEERKVSSSNYGEAGRVATEGAVKEIYNQLNSNNGVSNKLNELRNGLAGTVIYTDKDGNKLVKVNGKFYKQSELKNGELPVGSSYKDGIKEKDIFLSTVNSDGSTTTPTTKLRIADGSISVGSKEAVTGGQVYEIKNKVDTLTRDNYINFAGDSGNDIKISLAKKLSIVGEGDTTPAETAKNNITVQSEDDKLTVKLAKNLQNMKSFETEAKDGNKTTLNQDGLKIGNDTKAVKITNESITGLKDTSVDNTKYGQSGVVATQKEVKAVLNKVHSNEIEQKKIKDGLAGTVVYTDKDGNKLVKLNGKFYKQSELKNGELPVGSSYKDGIKEEDIFLSTVNSDGTTTKPITLGNVASALGLSKDSKNNSEILKKLVNKEAKDVYKDAELNKAVTLRDLQFLASKGITFAGSTGTANKYLGDTISINSKTSDYKDLNNGGFTTNYVTKNIAVKVDNTSGDIEIGLAKELKDIKSISSENDKSKIELTDSGLKLTNDNATLSIEKDGDNFKLSGLKDSKVDNGYGQSGVAATQKEVKDVLDKVNKNINGQNDLKDGLAGTVIYTDKDGNKLVKVNGAYYKQSDVKDGNVNDGATSISSDNIKVTLVGADGSIDKGVTLGNLKSTLGLNKANNGMTEINKKSILSKLTGNENYSEKELDNAVSLRDLQFVAKTGLVFSGNSGSVIKPIGETVRIIGGAKLSEKILEDTSSVIDPKAKYSDNGKEDFEKNFTSSSIATRVNEEGNIQIGISKDIKDIRTIEFTKGENEKAIGKIKGLANGEISSTSNDAINGAQLNDILDKVGIKVNDDKTGFNTLEISEIGGKKPSNILEGLNKTIESVNEQSVGYKANNGKVETVKLKEGFNFVNGTNTTANVGAKGEIKYSLNKKLKGIEELELKNKDKKLSLAVNNKGEAVIRREESIQSTEKVITTDDKLKLKFKSSTASDKNEKVINIAKNEALDFKAGSNLTSKVSDGSIEYGLKSDLKGITSISGGKDNKSKIELTDSGLKLTNDNETLSIEKDDNGFKLSGLKDSDVNNGYGQSGVAATQKEVKEVLDKVNKNIKGQNDLKDGLAGTVIYTDKDGNKLVKLKDGKYYNSDYVDEKGNLKVGHTYDKGLESHNIFATVVNPDGSTTTPTTKLRIADGSISAGSKEAVTGGQVYELKNKIEDISKKQFIKFKGDTNDEQTLNLGDTLEVVGEGDTTLAETAKNNITVQADKNKLTVKLAKKLQNMKSFETEAKDGNKTTLNQDGLKIGNDTKAVKITNESITGLTERKVSGSDYGEKGRAATEGAVKEVYDKLNTLNQGLTFKANKGQTKKEIGKILGVLGGATLKEKLIEDRSSIIDPKAKSSDNGKEDFDTNYNSKNVATRVGEDNNIHIGVSKELKDMRSFETEKDGEGNSSKLDQKELSIIGKDGNSINISNNEIKFGKNGGTISGLKGGKIEAGSTDAVSGGQVYEKLKTIDSHLNTNYYNKSKINEMIGEVDKKSTVALEKSELALGGVANAVAMANLVQVNSYSRHRHNLSAAYGYYGGSHALAVGFSGTNEERNFVYKLSGSVNNKGNLAFGVGAGVMLGEENENNYPEKVKKVSELENKVKKQEEEINKLKKQAEKTDMLEKQVAELMKLIKKKK
ncbi:YadA-like family protein [Sneathia vaginalis]|uniref:YadA-like family protein n=1 Tax=Sneathia vaginalis TaxID=187101 RepID=UPI0035C68EEC